MIRRGRLGLIRGKRMTQPREPKRWWLVCGLAAAATVVALFLWLGAASWIRAWPPYDIERVHGSLRSLELPYQSVRTEYYWDGGSVGIELPTATESEGPFACQRRWVRRTVMPACSSARRTIVPGWLSPPVQGTPAAGKLRGC